MNKLYWIWYQLSVGTSKNFLPLLDYFGSMEGLYNSNYLQRKVCPSLTDKMLDRMEQTSLDDAKEVMELCERNHWDIITYEDEKYPNKLKSIYDPPAVLYVSGSLPDIDNSLTVSIVGTREASPYALTSAELMAKGVSRCGGIIISGGALGVDCAAHKGALEANGITIAVLGCGLNQGYMNANSEIREMISSTGAIVTEFPPNVRASRFTFPQRNRIISGLCDGLLVVEAGVKSGSLITASYATSQNKDVFAISSSILDFNYAGTNKLLEDGAYLVTNTGSIINHYKEKYNLDLSKLATNEELLNDKYENKPIPSEIEEQLTFEGIATHRENRTEIDSKATKLSGNMLEVYNALEDDYLDIDTIAKRTSLEIKIVLITLTTLELDGLAQAGMGKTYRRKQS